jgi:hypothetical protein
MFVPTGVASAQPTGAPLIEYTRFAGGNWGSYDVSDSWGLPSALINAVPWVDPVTGYQNEYAVSTNNHLIEYTRLPTGQWVDADLTNLANGPLVTNTPAPFDDSPTVIFSTGSIQAVAVTTTDNHLAIYTRQPLGGWSAVDLTQSFNGPAVTADPAPFVDPVTGFLNVYATSTNDHLVAYTRMQTRWTTIDLTSTFTGPSIFNDPAPFIDPLTGFQNVYATTTNDDLVEYTRPTGPGYFGQWITVDITAAYGGPHIVDHPAPFVDPVTGLQNVYTTTTNSHLAEYTRNPNGSWISVDLTAVYQGAPVPSSPAPFVDPLNTKTQIAFGTTTGSHLVEYIRQPKGNWQIVDLTASYSGALVPGDPRPFVDPLTGFLNVYVTGIG